MAGNLNHPDDDVLNPPKAEGINLGPWRPDELPDVNLDTTECGRKLEIFSNSLIRARRQIPEGLSSTNQGLTLSRVQALEKKMAEVQLLFQQGIDSPAQRIALSFEIARLVEEAYLTLNNLFTGIHVYYSRKNRQMVPPRYVCWIYAHILFGFEHGLYPLIKPLKTSLEGKNNAPEIGTVSLPSLNERLESIKSLFGLPPKLDVINGPQIHTEDYSSRDILTRGKDVVEPGHILDEEGSAVEAGANDYKGPNWSPPFRSTPSLPASIMATPGGRFSIFLMKKFDEDQQGLDADDKTEDVLGAAAAPTTPARLATADVGEMFQIDNEGNGIPVGTPIGRTPLPGEGPSRPYEMPTERQLTKTRSRWMAWVAAAGLALAATGGGLWVIHNRAGSFGSGEVRAEKVEMSAPDIETMPSLAEIAEPTAEPAPVLETTIPTPVIPQVDAATNPDLEPKPGNWPWDILQKRVSERYSDGSGGITGEGQHVLAQMGADLLSQSATGTDLITSAHLPLNNPEYLTKIAPLLQTWGGWDAEVTRINEGDGLTLAQLLAELPQERANHLEATLASTRMNSETSRKMMELAQNMPFPEHQQEESSHSITPAQPEQPTQPDLQPDNDGQGFSPAQDPGNLDSHEDAISPYDAPEAPTQLLENPPIIESPKPEPEPSLWDYIEQPQNATDVPMPIGLWREQYPNATPEAVAEIVKRFNAPAQTEPVEKKVSYELPKAEPMKTEPVRVEQSVVAQTNVEPPKFEQIRKQTAVEQVVSAVSQKVRGLFGWVGKKLERALV